MNDKLQFLLLFFSTMLAGLLAGFFYTWSFTIMQSLNLIGESNAATAMISINANVRNGWFAALFFGAPLSILISLITMLVAKNRRIYLPVFLALVFAVATLVVTFSVHLPLNSELENGVSWSSYLGPWVQWNHVRTATSSLAFISMLYSLAFFLSFRGPSRINTN